MYYLKKKKKKKKKVILPHCQVVSRQCDENLSCAVFCVDFVNINMILLSGNKNDPVLFIKCYRHIMS